ncbi:hypothetical protein SAMN04488134_1262 [Amphibacillus marinus]|uniref:Uncharacterized protein n=1 Tax=Amphibacillus marinus TaxID=872970 RepID=A0A1H8U110_9BACI|nr:hypothetical protein [Amphibacillus marinus]SEO96805.1 hypothetical protein SAMN04488134_1262 [Amphibacillus marinus]
MLSDDSKFINDHFLDYTKKNFLKYFEKDIILKNEEYSNDSAGMGFYRLTYEYLSYQIIFEYERLRFTIRIKYKDAVSNFFAQHKELLNSLTEENINKSIFILKSDLKNNNLSFFYITKKGEIKKIEF